MTPNILNMYLDSQRKAREAKTKKKTVKEEAPTVNAGSGNVAGIGVGPKGEPGVDKKKKKRGVVLSWLRRQGLPQKATPISKRKPTGLGEEQLDEISKKKLGQYIKKASHDVATRSAATARYAERAQVERKKQKDTGDYSGWQKARSDDEFSNKMFDKSWKRRKGIAKAVDKIVKEGEQLDELSNQKLRKYIKRSSDKREAGIMKAKEKIRKKKLGLNEISAYTLGNYSDKAEFSAKSLKKSGNIKKGKKREKLAWKARSTAMKQITGNKTWGDINETSPASRAKYYGRSVSSYSKTKGEITKAIGANKFKGPLKKKLGHEIFKRVKGQLMAQRLGMKESAINEISLDKVQRYMAKSQSDKVHQQGIKKYVRGDDFKKEADDIIKKRDRGLGMARKRLLKKKSLNEVSTTLAAKVQKKLATKLSSADYWRSRRSTESEPKGSVWDVERYDRADKELKDKKAQAKKDYPNLKRKMDYANRAWKRAAEREKQNKK